MRSTGRNLVETKKIPVGNWYGKLQKAYPELFLSQNVKLFVGSAVKIGLDRETILAACEVTFNCNRGTARDCWGRQVVTKKASCRKSTYAETKTVGTASVVALSKVVSSKISSLGKNIISDSKLKSQVKATDAEWSKLTSLPGMVKYMVEIHGKKLNGLYWGPEDLIKTIKVASANA
jgi:hypothetical protein